MIKGVTESGFEYELSKSRLNNFELLEIFAEIDNNPLLFPRALTMLLGDEQKKKLYDHVRDDEGIVPTDLINIEIKEIFNSNQVKN